jgi:hypothetical protein
MSRKNILDYNERKKYLYKVVKINEETKNKLEEYAKAIEYDLEVKKYFYVSDKRKKSKCVIFIWFVVIYIILNQRK